MVLQSAAAAARTASRAVRRPRRVSRPGPGRSPMMLDATLETLDAARLRAHQWRRLRALLDEIYGVPGNPFWRAAWARAGVTSPHELKTWDDFQRLPCSTKRDLIDDQAAHP